MTTTTFLITRSAAIACMLLFVGVSGCVDAGNSIPSGATHTASSHTESLEPMFLRYEAGAADVLSQHSFEVPAGVERLSFTVFLNSSEPGPYWVDGAQCLCDPWLALYSPTDIPGWDYSWRRIWGYVGGEPVAGVGPDVILGPFEGSVKSPGEGTWVIQLRGSGQNAVAMFTGNRTFG